jgi:hypothetical protein
MTTAVLESTAILPQIKWINLNKAKRTLQLPEPWLTLEASSFHQDILDRAYAHLAYCTEYGGLSNAMIVLGLLGEGFIRPFDRVDFDPGTNDPHFGLKTNALDALSELAEFYGDRVSSVVWHSLAYLAARAEPEVEQSIIQADGTGTLPYAYTLVDSALHATGLVYTFLMHVNSVMFRHTGRVLVHNCDCNCSLVNLEEMGGRIEYALPEWKIIGATQSVFTHLLAETHKLMESFLPFAYSITPEACKIKALL